MKRYRITAILGSIILALITFLPLFITMSKGYELSHPEVVGIFLYQAVGVSVAAVVIFLVFLRNRDG